MRFGYLESQSYIKEKNTFTISMLCYNDVEGTMYFKCSIQKYENFGSIYSRQNQPDLASKRITYLHNRAMMELVVFTDKREIVNK